MCTNELLHGMCLNFKKKWNQKVSKFKKCLSGLSNLRYTEFVLETKINFFLLNVLKLLEI